jgi:hypothetical protein
MEPTDAAADTTKALEAALEAAYREREALTRRLETVEQLIDHLMRTAAESAAQPGAGGRGGTRTSRGASKRTARKAGAKRTGRKTAKRAGRGRRRQAPGRTERVIEIVSTASEPLTTGDVRARLANEEPDVSSKLVSAALTYAARKGRIGRQDGHWVGA